ncbi:GGDEF domain-containing protein [Pigmentiphaga litoralis]|nr:GGDEF domain-containing protein [Pigmentiphaga litoralis]
MHRHIPPHLPADGAPGSLTLEDWDALARSGLFAGTTAEQRLLVEPFACTRHLAHGAFLLQPGEANSNIYVLVEGQLGAYRDAATQRMLARFVPGDAVGEHALIGQEGGTVYVAAQWPSRLVVLNAAALRAVIDAVPRIAINVLDMLSERLRAMNLRLEPDEQAESMDFMATHDAVTGLHNRRWMSDAFQSEIAQSQQAGQLLHLMLMDIDHFDRFNQALGRNAGDAILRQLADLIRQVLPGIETLVRVSGDRFAALLSDVTLNEAVAACDRLRNHIAGRQFALRGHIATQITVSIGITPAGTDLDTALGNAAIALARAKERGRNLVESLPS